MRLTSMTDSGCKKKIKQLDISVSHCFILYRLALRYITFPCTEEFNRIVTHRIVSYAFVLRRSVLYYAEDLCITPKCFVLRRSALCYAEVLCITFFCIILYYITIAWQRISLHCISSILVNTYLSYYIVLNRTALHCIDFAQDHILLTARHHIAL